MPHRPRRDPLAAHHQTLLARLADDERALQAATDRLRDAVGRRLDLGWQVARRPLPWLGGSLLLGWALGVLSARRGRGARR